jgi:predicted ATPase
VIETLVKRVRIKDYKSIPSADVVLEPLTILVGPNGAGKSNFIDALALVAEAMQSSSLEFALRQRGGLAEVRRRSTGHPRNFSISVDIALPDRINAFYAFEVGATKDGGFFVAKEKAQVERAGRFDPIGYSIDKGVLRTASPELTFQAEIPSDRLMLPLFSAAPGLKALHDVLQRMRFYSIAPTAFRQPQPHDAGDVLLPTGSNTASVVRRLGQDDPDALARAQDYMARIVPGLERIEHASLGPLETLTFHQEVKGSAKSWKFFAAAVSDGTLRSLGVLMAMFQTHPRLGLPSLVGIEEPESTIHPGAAGLLMDSLLEASETRQILLTTHSPELIDHHAVSMESLRIVDNDAGDTRIAEADAASREAVRDKLFTPGELMRKNQLTPRAGDAGRARQSDFFQPLGA